MSDSSKTELGKDDKRAAPERKAWSLSERLVFAGVGLALALMGAFAMIEGWWVAKGKFAAQASEVTGDPARAMGAMLIAFGVMMMSSWSRSKKVSLILQALSVIGFGAALIWALVSGR